MFIFDGAHSYVVLIDRKKIHILLAKVYLVATMSHNMVKLQICFNLCHCIVGVVFILIFNFRMKVWMLLMPRKFKISRRLIRIADVGNRRIRAKELSKAKTRALFSRWKL